MTTAKAWFNSLRPHQWIKNGFILAPLVFAQKVFSVHELVESVQAVIAFCALSSAVYIFNDLVDLEADRNHPVKRKRPLASGAVSTRLAVVTGVIFVIGAMLWGWGLGYHVFIIMGIYLVIQLLYNVRLKEVVILDIFCVSSGFFLRVMAGANAIDVPMSRWLIICSILIAMFLTLCKRRNELMILGKDKAGSHRKVLDEYDVHLLDQLIGIIAGSTLLSYLLYCLSEETMEKFHTDRLIYTFPFVLYGVFRYLYLIHHKREGGSPEKLFFSDRPLLLSVVLWGLASTLITARVF